MGQQQLQQQTGGAVRHLQPLLTWSLLCRIEKLIFGLEPRVEVFVECVIGDEDDAKAMRGHHDGTGDFAATQLRQQSPLTGAI